MGASPESQLAGSIAPILSQPLKAFVVESEITNAQNNVKNYIKKHKDAISKFFEKQIKENIQEIKNKISEFNNQIPLFDIYTENLYLVNRNNIYNKVSCDSTSNFIYIDMNGFMPERYYRLEFKIVDGFTEQYVSDKIYFKVVR